MASIKRNSPMTGLTNAMRANVDDPLGTNVKRRGMDAYNEEARQNDPNYMSGPLPDPQWEGMLQAMNEAAEGKALRVGMDAGRPHGIADDPAWAAQGDVGALAGTGDHIPTNPLMQSTNIAGPAQQLARLSGGVKQPLPESHEAFMARLARQYGKNPRLGG